MRAGNCPIRRQTNKKGFNDMGKTLVQPQRLYAHLDSIAEARRHSDLQERRREVQAAEASANAFPINPGGWTALGRATMQAQVSELAAQKREQIKWIESLTNDDLVRMYCPEIVAEAEAPSVPVTINGEPLARGSRPAMAPPGMF